MTDIDTIDQRLARIETALAGLATKADLAEAVAGVAKNVEVTALGINVRTVLRASEAVRDDMRVVTAIALRLEHTLADAMVQQQMRVADRVRALEDEREPPQ